MLNKEEILSIIPHRDPFMFLDEVSELIPLEYAKGSKIFTNDEHFFKGHFPDFPVVPGVILIEAIAQLGATAALTHEDYKNKIVYLTGISKVKIRKSVLPGDKVEFVCKLDKIKRGFGVGIGQAFVSDNLVCEARISFAIK